MAKKTQDVNKRNRKFIDIIKVIHLVEIVYSTDNLDNKIKICYIIICYINY